MAFRKLSVRVNKSCARLMLLRKGDWIDSAEGVPINTAVFSKGSVSLRAVRVKGPSMLVSTT